jgi:hypothetical protein
MVVIALPHLRVCVDPFRTILLPTVVGIRRIYTCCVAAVTVG